MQLHELLLRSAQNSPDARMVWETGKWNSYADVCLTAKRVAGFLVSSAGTARGDRVALLWDNSANAIASAFGVWMAGCVLVPLNTDLRGDDLLYQIDHSEARLVLSGARQLRNLHSALAGRQVSLRVVADGPLPPSDRDTVSYEPWSVVESYSQPLEEPTRTIDIDLAAIVYTSGSTGRPKGVMLTHLNLVSNTTSVVGYLGLRAEDRILLILPHFYIYGMSLVLTHTMVGGAIVIDNRFMYPNTVLGTINETGVTGFSGVPSTFSIMLARSSIREMSFPSLRYVTQAGGAMPVPVQKEVSRAFAPAVLFVMYGATEASPRLSYLDPDDLERKWGSIGRPIPNVELLVADAEGRPVPDGEEGELVARGSNITAGYWKDPEESALVIHGGLYHTGDLGYRDKDGFLFVTGRAKDILKVKGFRVSPAEIEELITEVDGVTAAAVIGVADDVLGEAPVAYLESGDPTVSVEEIRKRLQRRLPVYKQPVEYIVLDSLPKSAAGKIQKTVLRDLYREQHNDRASEGTAED